MDENRKRNIQVKFRVDEKEYECILKKIQLSGKEIWQAIYAIWQSPEE